MKKRNIAILICAFAGIACIPIGLIISSFFNDDNEKIETPNIDPEQVKFDDLNNLIKLDYKEANISLITSSNNNLDSLNSTYNLINDNDFYNISYRIESYSKIDLENNIIPEELKEIKEGNLEKKGKFSFENLIINKKIFTSFIFSENSFNGLIKNGKDYLKTDYNLNDFKLEIHFKDKLESIQFDYILDNKIKQNVNIKIKA